MFPLAQWPYIIIGGLASALICGLALTGSFGGLLLAYFCLLPLFLVGFGMGAAASVVAGGIAAAATAVPGGVLGAAIFIVLNVAPVILLTRQSLLSRPDDQGGVEWYPPGLLVTVLTILTAGLYTLAILWLAFQPEGVIGTLREFVGGFVDSMISPERAEQREWLIDMVVPLLPGSIAASWLVMVAVNACLAQGLLARLGRNLRPSPPYSATELPRWMAFAMGLTIAIGLLVPGLIGFYSKNLAVILVIPYLFVGLAVVHVLCRRLAGGGFLLGLVYAILVMLGWPVVLVAILGLIEQFAGLRRRYAAPGPNEEV
jgi:hypothetical protein